MSRYRYRPYRRRESNPEALAHIEAARQLSAELGGADQEVKDFFFSMPPDEMRDLLEDYGRLYGWSAREYAERTIPKWRTGRVAMSGRVAERLFNLLPRQMPLDKRYGLAATLWEHLGPRSDKVVLLGRDITTEDVVDFVREYMDDVVTQYVLPPSLESRFTWLANSDVAVKQQMLNYLRQLDKQNVIDSIMVRIPIILDYSHNEHAQSIRESVSIGNHRLTFLVDMRRSGISILHPSMRRAPEQKTWNPLWFWLAPLIGIAAYLYLR